MKMGSEQMLEPAHQAVLTLHGGDLNVAGFTLYSAVAGMS